MKYAEKVEKPNIITLSWKNLYDLELIKINSQDYKNQKNEINNIRRDLEGSMNIS